MAVVLPPSLEEEECPLLEVITLEEGFIPLEEGFVPLEEEEFNPLVEGEDHHR
jgi:hypothetical protein